MPSPYDLKDNASGQSEDAGMAVNLTGLPPSLFEKYSKGPTAQLMPADPKKGYATPYYAAYTNDGDIAGAVMVAEGQKVRLVDKMTGEVVFEGIGPEGARLATSTANAISQDLGRTAAWAIQKPTDEGGWVSMAEERWDPEKQGFLGKLADIALPILGTLLMPVLGPLGPIISAGLGAAAGSALSSVAQGRSLDETVKRAAIAGVTAGIGAKVVPMLGNALANAPQNAVTNALNTGYSAVMNPLNAGANAVRGAAGTAGNIIKGGLNAAGEVIVAPSVTSALTGGALGSVTGSTAGGALTGSSGQPALRGDAGGDTLNQGNTVEDVVVEGTNADAVTGGALGAATTPGAGTGTTVSDVVVEGTGNDTTTGGALGAATTPGAGTGTTVSDVVVEGTGNDTTTGGAIGTTVGDGISGSEGSDTLEDTSTDDEIKTPAQKLLDWVKANPELAAKLGLNLASLLGGAAAGGGSTTGGGIPPGFATAGTPGSLSDKFRAQLPAPSGPFGNLAGRDVAMTPEEWKTYGARPEQSFFANVPIRPSGIIEPPARRAPVTPGPSPAEAEPGLRANINPDVRVAPGYWPEPNSPTQPVSGANQPYDPMAEERAYWEARERQRAEREGRPYVPASNGKALAMERLGGAPATAPTSTSTGFKAKVTPDVQVAPGYWPEPNSPTQPVSGANQPKGEAVFRDVVFDDGSPVPPGWVDPYLPATGGQPLGAQGAASSQPVPGFNPSAVIPDYLRDDGFNQPGNNLAPFAVALDKLRGRQAPPLPAPSKGFKVGGFAVRGPGTGRSDDIPARLSDGEYVIDAETVALLGDGSSQAGSKRLDEFRANIRKHKGRQLAKGKFSHDARKPEAYLHGGQV